MSWKDELQQATWRGIPFGVLTSEQHFGRRQAVHEYPYRDKPWAEDLGRETRHIAFRGFLVEDDLVYGGGAVVDQKNQMIGAAEQSGTGTLIHPTLGTLTVSLQDLMILDQWDTGRYFELNFTFIESGEKTFPSQSAATGPGGPVGPAAANANAAAASDLTSVAQPLLSAGPQAFTAIVASAGAWAGQIGALAGDATNLFGLAALLPGNFGRYFNGANLAALVAGGPLLISPYTGETTIDELIATASAQNTAIATAVANVNTIAANVGLGEENNTPADLAAAVQGAIAALSLAAPDPANAIRLMGLLAGYTPPATVSLTAMGWAIGDAVRRSAVASMAVAALSYQPSSANDAQATLSAVVSFIHHEIAVAGDQGADATFAAMRWLRSAVVQDLNARGADLSPLAVVVSAEATPALVLAQRLYRDPTRSDQLVAQADPINPLFMPVSFQALAA